MRESPAQLGASLASSVSAFAAPVGVPSGATGSAQMRLIMLKASHLPSGDQTGPSSPRVEIERFGAGSIQRCLPLATSTSRMRLRLSLSAVNAIVRPSADQLGRLGKSSAGTNARSPSPETSTMRVSPVSV